MSDKKHTGEISPSMKEFLAKIPKSNYYVSSEGLDKRLQDGMILLGSEGYSSEFYKIVPIDDKNNETLFDEIHATEKPVHYSDGEMSREIEHVSDTNVGDITEPIETKGFSTVPHEVIERVYGALMYAIDCNNKSLPMDISIYAHAMKELEKYRGEK